MSRLVATPQAGGPSTPAPATAAAAAAAAAAGGPPPANAFLGTGPDEVLKLVHLLPPGVRQRLEGHPQLASLLEVVLDLGRPPLARFPTGDQRLSEAPITADDLQHAIEQVRAGAEGRGAY